MYLFLEFYSAANFLIDEKVKVDFQPFLLECNWILFDFGVYVQFKFI